MPNRPHKPIALAIIRRGKKYLVARRKPERELGGLWEFPGGKIEPGESAEQAAERECHEELGCHAHALREIALVRHTYDSFSVELHAIECDLESGAEPQALDASEIAWMTLDQLLAQPIPAANHALIGAIHRDAECFRDPEKPSL